MKACTGAMFFSCSQKTAFKWILTFALGEQETGVGGIEVALGAEEVKRLTVLFGFAEESAFFPCYPNIRLDQVPIRHLALQVFLKAGDA